MRALNRTMNANAFVYDVGMCGDPNYYSGRGATTSDLNSTQLDRIHHMIQTHLGEDAASNFVRMVAHIEVLSATRFLQALYALESNAWVFVPGEQPSNVCVTSPGSAFGTMAMGYMKFNDATETIRGSFLRTHRADLPDNYEFKEIFPSGVHLFNNKNPQSRKYRY